LKESVQQKINLTVDECPQCKHGEMLRILSFDANAPPNYFLQQIIKQKQLKN